jgi:hypothetical protein
MLVNEQILVFIAVRWTKFSEGEIVAALFPHGEHSSQSGERFI